MKFREAREYYRGRLAESMQKDIHEKAATIMRAPGGLKRLVKTLFDSSPSGADETAPRAAAPTEEPEELAASRRTAARRKLTDSYNRIMDCYVPQTYDSRLTLFWPDEAPAEEFNDPTMGWRKVASVVDVRAIRGAHLTCITRHVEVLAQQLRECLQHAQSGRGLQ
jgi:thioesterase domain-containing protein